ncbi:MAG: hypothetical protein WD825_09125 [Gemmatimonadaceae bacterium]
MAAAAVAIGACDEQLTGGIACPALCPGPALTMRDTTLFAVVLDTSIAGFPALGGEGRFYIASLGDTLETAAAIRYDSLPKFFRGFNSPDDSTINVIDTGSYVELEILARDTLALPTTIELYDIEIDSVGDEDPTTVAAAFTPDRLLSSRTVPADSLRGTVRIPIDPNFLLSKILVVGVLNRVRLGVKVAQTGNPRMTMLTDNSVGGATIVFRPSLDTLVPIIRVFPLSRRPAEAVIARELADYQVVIKGPPEPPPFVLRVGGLPSRRTYLRFDIPPAILDSSNVVRATLILTQRPNPAAPEPTDTVSMGHFGVVAGAAVTDLSRALGFLQRLANRDTINMVAADSGDRTFEMIDWVRLWRGTKPEKTPRAIAFATTLEGEIPRLADFFSTEEVDASVRPRLRLTYLPRVGGPLP